jgi:hypothetical protein
LDEKKIDWLASRNRKMQWKDLACSFAGKMLGAFLKIEALAWALPL